MRCLAKLYRFDEVRCTSRRKETREAFARFNWITVAYKCTRCAREFVIKIET